MKVSWGCYSQYMESHKIHVPNHQPVILLLYTSVGTTFWRQGTLEVPCSIRRFMVPWQAAFVAGPGGQGAGSQPYALGVQACNYVIIRLWNIINIQHCCHS
jgi:hypothetical protein